MDPSSSQCSPASNSSQGIIPNPDISGIGVRTAIYIQAVLTLVHAIVAGYDGHIDDFEVKSLVAVFLGILLPGCALLFSAIIQARTFGLSAYHAMIVLFLSWINNTSALTFFVYIVGEQVFGRPYQLFKESRKLMEEQPKTTDLDAEWEMVDGLGRLHILKKVQEILDKLNLDMSGTKSTSLTRELWGLVIQKWTIWREMKIMTILYNQGDSPESLMRWEEEGEENETELRNISAEMEFGDHLTNMQLREIIKELPSKMRFKPVLKSRAIPYRFFRGAKTSQKPIWLMGTMASAHLILLSAFGLWFWSTLPNFGVNQECIPSIRFIFITKPIPITSEVLRSRSKAIYIFSSLPGINIHIWILIFMLASMVGFAIAVCSLGGLLLLPMIVIFLFTSMASIWVELKKTFLEFKWVIMPRLFFSLAIITTLTAQTFLIALTELTIAHNRHLLQSKEGDWTFGQTLALTLTLIPLIEVVKFLRDKR